ncbi:MAG TPA: hypothetical protein VG297_10800 [Bryobacteraceae bacterium]|nr:hypothetical protein [Bryobacteraceae bacterium]
MARWNVDQKITDMAEADGLEVLDDGVNVPARNERRRRLDYCPCLHDEFAQAPDSEFGVNLVA